MTDPLGEQFPIDLAIVDWLVENDLLIFGALPRLRAALVDDDLVLGFPPALFDAREQLVAKVDAWLTDQRARLERVERGEEAS